MRGADVHLTQAMTDQARPYLLGPLLKSVSRSFYLTMRILPAGMRDPIGLAYLLARAADTIADTSLVAPGRRLELLLSLRARVNGAPDDTALDTAMNDVARQQTQPDEKVLLESLPAALAVLSSFDDADRQAVREIVTTLTQGMEFDLRTFPDETSGQVVALREFDEMDRYTYLVAGCVGEFWTKMTYAHMPGTLAAEPATMAARGIRFGKALQMVNILRDCGKDLRIGRCYLPDALLGRYGLTVHDLLAPDASMRARGVLLDATRMTLDHFRDAIAYTLAIPAFSARLRLACLWPIMIGMETLALLIDNEHWLDPQRVSKVKRGDVYRIMALSMPMVASDALVKRWFERMLARIEARL
ncbi:squalene/phytoene synthase family protein [Caballeronia humi]|uniref:Squalene/phytoene synthase family protein n=2 Tax=Caballeronia humi TaxID=326474 RepID=A0A158ID81_9BURK|nr:phytoene/squalene synthase family protein [Caballeronia humi]SAL53950.1 squalene/phytoene synthase family protein [Caballeronia humi]